MATKVCQDDMHQHYLKKHCRLCGKQQDSTKSLQDKERFSDMIVAVLGLDVAKDEVSVHPPCICDSCRSTLKRLKKKLGDSKKKKTKQSEDNPMVSTMTLHNFLPHTLSCQVCPHSIDFHRLSVMGQAAGYVPTLSEHFLTLSKLSHDGTYVVCHGKINMEGTCRVVVGCRDVTRHNIVQEDCVSSLMDTLRTKKVCSGNKGFEDVMESRRSNEIIVVFRDSHNIEVAREEPENTIRHVNCLGFVDGDGEMCSKCTNFRSSLRKSRSRLKESSGQPSSTFTRNDRLSEEQKIKKLGQLVEEKKTLHRQLKVTEARLSNLITTEGVDLTKDLSQDLEDIAAKHDFEEGSMQQIFWQQQQQCLQSHQGNRWHPAMIRFCIGLHAKSPGAYDALRTSGVLTLPSSRTLRDYTYFTQPRAGLDPEVMERISTDCDILHRSDIERNVVLAFDEIHICQGLVYSSETEEVVGWVDVGDLSNLIQQVTQEDKRMPLATQIMCVMIRGLFISLNQVFTFFPSTGCSADELFYLIWESVMFVELYGFKVRALTCDGASANRKFYRLGVMDQQEVHFAPNPRRSIKEKIFYVCDVPHLIKTTRNNWENSGWNSKSKNLMYRGQNIKWPQLIQLVEENNPHLQKTSEQRKAVSILQSAPKLSPQHIYLTPSLRMRVKLATQVLSNTVKEAFALSPALKEKTKSTQLFINMFDTFFDCLNVRRLGQDERLRKPALAPYRHVDDWRFKWLLDDFLGFLSDWDEESLGIADLTKKEKARLCLSRETLEGLRITVRSFVELAKLLLYEGAPYVLSARFNQDPLEQYFSKQRGLGGARENPDVKSFSYNHLKLIVAGSGAVRAATRGNTCCEETATMVMQPLPKRQKKN